MRVLIVEDESRLAELLVQAVDEAGWSATVAVDGPSALTAARTGGHDVIVLDWMLPGIEGPDVVQRLRADGYDTPVLLLTARGALPDRVAGLDAGADDYLAKPFEVDELLARLRALHRRATPTAVTALRAGDLVIDPETRRVSRAGRDVLLSAREFDILVLLMERAGQYVSRFAILDGVWDGETDLSSNVIDVHIARLRAKIDTPFGRSAIQTLRGVGYRLDPAGG
ncbi:DNA-binding response regulator, OmpR family, contains REC and winged-helix (wHTH) domain [Modestobacter sp. DSM 44400]|uniref:response regulator transcription factor n=1 Tax=Modestobacter sp. DSM 44400 TaxID=1550230 RepID=UPI0008971F26|nr:response regulator transcription factor [Modestobacter sp. DSM 44400]SDX80771.1 DNA-binding response regulator, OmpR family, contains REC and winged-helix (wHTH) domain [Modestobacter sp. DSM 44400]